MATVDARSGEAALTTNWPPALRPLAHDASLPQAEAYRITVPAPPGWRRRSGEDGVTRWAIHGRRWGATTDRPPIVLVHGLGVAARLVAPTARRLGVGGLVLAPDLPGHGLSDKPRPVPTIAELGEALSSWLATACPAPAVLVGVSLGTQVVVHAALRTPPAVRAVVLASPVVEPSRRRWRSQLWRWQLEQATQSIRLKAIQIGDYRRAGLGLLLRTFSSALTERPEEKVERLRAPVLVCRGTRDPLVSAGWARELRARCGGELVTLPGAVHAMSHDNPTELSRAILGFLDRIAPRPTDEGAAGG